MASSGNFATLLNGLLYQVGTNTTYSIGNLKYQSSTSGEYSQQASTIAPSSGKWYAEMYVNTVGNLHWLCLVGDVGVSDTTNRNAYANRTTNGGMGYAHSGLVRYNGSDTSSGYSTYTNGDIIQIAFDIDNTKVWFGKNNTWQNSGDPANGTNASYTTWTTTYGTLPKHWHVASNIGNTGAATFNFGQDDTFGGVITAAGNADGNGHGVFKYAPPTGFLAMCSANLPVSDDIDPAQTDSDYPAKQFGSVLYTGNGTSNNAITGLGFQPDLVWTKNRSNVADYSNALVDSSRGRAKVLYSQRTDAEPSDSGASDDVKSFDSDGFTVGTGNNISINANTHTYVGWCWRANGGTTASNTDGSITSTVQANTAAGFSIITYTGTGSNATIGHGLSAKPDFILFKRRSGGVQNWKVYHTGTGVKVLTLNDSRAVETDSSMFNNTEPTSSVISIGTQTNVNTSSGDQLCYAWHDVEGFQKFGTYEGNGNADGPFIYTGFRPRMLFIKNSEQSANWEVHDTARSTFNVVDDYLFWDTNATENSASGTFAVDILSNGFKIRSTETNLNTSGRTFIYGAWADVPFKYNNTF